MQDRTQIILLLVCAFVWLPLSRPGAQPAPENNQTNYEASDQSAPAVERRNRMAGVRPNSVANPLPATRAARLRGMRLNQLADDARRRFLWIREIAADGRLERARRALVDFLIVYPESTYKYDASDLLGDVLARQGRAREAARAYQQAYQSAPEQARALESYLKAGRLYAQLGQLERARRIFREVIRKQPSSPASRLAQLELRSAPLVDLEGRDHL